MPFVLIQISLINILVNVSISLKHMLIMVSINIYVSNTIVDNKHGVNSWHTHLGDTKIWH